MLKSHVISQHDRRTTEREGPQSKFHQDAPPLMPTLTSSKYHIKWTRLADLSAAIFRAHVAVQDRKIYVSGGISPVKDAEHQVFVYEIDNDSWGQLPIPDHYYAVPHIIGGKLTVIGGRLITTNKRTNKVSTFDQTNQTWMSYYPDLLSVRSRPGVVTHMEHVIVAGGIRGDDSPVVLDDIEVLDWVENCQWKRVSVHLPVPMCAFQPTIFDDHLFIVGYTGADMHLEKLVHKLPIALITNSAYQLHCTSTRWVKLVQTIQLGSMLVHGLSPLVVVGGEDVTGTTADVMMFDKFRETWKKIDSLSFARSEVAVAAINNNAVIVIGGCTKGGSITNAKSSSLTVVELGRVEKV